MLLSGERSESARASCSAMYISRHAQKLWKRHDVAPVRWLLAFLFEKPPQVNRRRSISYNCRPRSCSGHPTRPRPDRCSPSPGCGCSPVLYSRHLLFGSRFQPSRLGPPTDHPLYYTSQSSLGCSRCGCSRLLPAQFVLHTPHRADCRSQGDQPSGRW